MRQYKPTGRPRGRPRKAQKLTPVMVYLPEELVQFVDEHRGSRKRSEYIRQKIALDQYWVPMASEAVRNAPHPDCPVIEPSLTLSGGQLIDCEGEPVPDLRTPESVREWITFLEWADSLRDVYYHARMLFEDDEKQREE